MNTFCKLEIPKLNSCDYEHKKKKKKRIHSICSIHGADKESVNSRYISVYCPFMSVSIVEHGAVNNTRVDNWQVLVQLFFVGSSYPLKIVSIFLVKFCGELNANIVKHKIYIWAYIFSVGHDNFLWCKYRNKPLLSNFTILLLMELHACARRSRTAALVATQHVLTA